MPPPNSDSRTTFFICEVYCWLKKLHDPMTLAATTNGEDDEVVVATERSIPRLVQPLTIARMSENALEYRLHSDLYKL